MENITSSLVLPSDKPLRKRGFTKENAKIIGARGGKAKKGIRSIKPALEKIFTKEKAEELAKNIIDEAIRGDDCKRKDLLKLNKDLDDNPQVNLTQNTFNIPPEVIELARSMINNKVIDVDTTISPTPLIEDKVTFSLATNALPNVSSSLESVTDLEMQKAIKICQQTQT